MRKLALGILAISSILASTPVFAQTRQQPREVTIYHPGFKDKTTGITTRIGNFQVYNGLLILALESVDERDNLLFTSGFAPVKCSTGEASFMGATLYSNGNHIDPAPGKKEVYIRNFYKLKDFYSLNLVVACKSARDAGFQLK